MPLTSPEVTLPDGVGVYFLSGHRRLSEEPLHCPDATPPEASPGFRFPHSQQVKARLFQGGKL
jgi:hypothetical protein